MIDRRTPTCLLRRAVAALVCVACVVGCGDHNTEPTRSAATLSTVDVVTRGIEQMSLGNEQEALDSLTEGFSLPVDRAKFAHFNAGLIQYRNKDFGPAETNYRKAFELDPLFVEPQFNLAVMLRETGRALESVAIFVTVSASSSTLRVPALKNLSELARQAGDDVGAAKYDDQLLAIEKANPTTTAVVTN